MASSRVYAVASGKGGVGKTTSAVNLGAAFAEAGRTVAVVDVDLGMANLGDMLDVDTTAPTLHDVLAGDADLEQSLRAAPGEFDAIVGSRGIEPFGRADPAGLRDVVDDLRERYDVVVLDTGAGLSYDAALPLGIADSVILVTTPDDAALNNAEMTSDVVDRIGGTVAGVIVNRMGVTTGTSPSAIASQLDVPVLGSVPEDSAVAESAAKGIPLVVEDRTSPAAQSFREIAYGILEEPLPRGWAKESPDEQEAAADEETEDEDDIIVADTGADDGAEVEPSDEADGDAVDPEADGVTEEAAEPGDTADDEDAEAVAITADEGGDDEKMEVDDVVDPADDDIIEAATEPMDDEGDHETDEESVETAKEGQVSHDEDATEVEESGDSNENDESGGPGIADAIESAESDPEGGDAGALVETIDETDGSADEDEDSRSLLSKLTGGLFG